MRPRRRVYVIAASIFLGVAVAACGAEPSPTPPPVPEATAPAPSPPLATATVPPTPMPPQPAPVQAAPISAPTPTSAPEAAAAEIRSKIQDFSLQDFEVTVGTTVKWTNHDSVHHTTTSDPPGESTGIWGSGFLNDGDSFSFTFTEAGTFPYFCRAHPGSMSATVTVVAADRGVTAPQPATPGPSPETAAATVPPPTPTSTPAPTAPPIAAPPSPTPGPTATPVPPAPTATPTTVSQAAPAEAPLAIKVDIINFELLDLAVAAGTTVTWVNKDPVTHTSTSGTPVDPTGVWNSAFLTVDESFSFTFNEVGTFPYFCDIHNSMTGTVTVVEGEVPAPGSARVDGSPGPIPEGY